MSEAKSGKRGRYLNPKKLGRRTRQSIPREKRKNVGVRRLKAGQYDMLEREQQALKELVENRNIRIKYMRGTLGKVDPILVYADFDGLVGFLHDKNPKDYPRWEELSDAAKARLGFLLCLAFEGYSFTVNVSEKLEKKWLENGLNPRDRAIDKINKELKIAGLAGTPYFFVVEAKGKGGKSRTHLHLHGYCLLAHGHQATRFKIALEKALYRELKVSKGSGPPVEIKRSYELNDEPQSATYWVGYSMKNALLPGPKIKGTPLYLNDPLRQSTHEFWGLVREED